MPYDSVEKWRSYKLPKIDVILKSPKKKDITVDLVQLEHRNRYLSSAVLYITEILLCTAVQSFVTTPVVLS